MIKNYKRNNYANYKLLISSVRSRCCPWPEFDRARQYLSSVIWIVSKSHRYHYPTLRGEGELAPQSCRRKGSAGSDVSTPLLSLKLKRREEMRRWE